LPLEGEASERYARALARGFIAIFGGFFYQKIRNKLAVFDGFFHDKTIGNFSFLRIF